MHNKKEIISVAKSESNGLDFKSVYNIFLNSDNIEEIKEAVKQSNDRIYLSWSTVDVVDKQGEKIPINDAIKQEQSHLERGGPISNEHTNDIIGRTIDFKVMIHPKANKIGILTLNKIFDHNEMDDQIWEDIKSRKKIGSSVGGFKVLPAEYEKDEEGNLFKVLAGFRQNETAITENPANQYATLEAFSAVAKSGDLIDGKYVIKGDSVYKIEKKGSVLKACEDESNKVSVKKEKKQEEYIKGDNTMVENSNALEAALKKIQKSEPLSEEEKTLVKAAMGEESKEPEKEESEDQAPAKEEEKKKKSDKGEEISQNTKETPENPDPEEVNQVDVTKKVKSMIDDALKVQKEKFDKEIFSVKKGLTPVASTPKPSEKKEMDPVQKSSIISVDPVQIAMGKVKKSWGEVQMEDKRLMEKCGESQ